MEKLGILALVGLLILTLNRGEEKENTQKAIERDRDRVNTQFLVLYEKEEKGKELYPFLNLDEKALLIDKYGDASEALIWNNLEEKYKEEVEEVKERKETLERLSQKKDFLGTVRFFFMDRLFGTLFKVLLISIVVALILKILTKKQKEKKDEFHPRD